MVIIAVIVDEILVGIVEVIVVQKVALIVVVIAV